MHTGMSSNTEQIVKYNTSEKRLFRKTLQFCRNVQYQGSTKQKGSGDDYVNVWQHQKFMTSHYVMHVRKRWEALHDGNTVNTGPSFSSLPRNSK